MHLFFRRKFDNLISRNDGLTTIQSNKKVNKQVSIDLYIFQERFQSIFHPNKFIMNNYKDIIM